MTIKELKKRVSDIDDLNVAIANGKKLITTVYQEQDYCPKVEVLTLTHDLFSIVKILEGKRKGETVGYWWPDREDKIVEFRTILKQETGFLYS